MISVCFYPLPGGLLSTLPNLRQNQSGRNFSVLVSDKTKRKPAQYSSNFLQNNVTISPCESASQEYQKAASMTDETSKTAHSDPLLEKSSLYQEFLAEREEIMRHKWLKSEEAGHDIGFDATLLDWVMHYRNDWLRERKAKAEAHQQ